MKRTLYVPGGRLLRKYWPEASVNSEACPCSFGDVATTVTNNMGTPVASSVTVPWMAPVVVVCAIAVGATSSATSPKAVTAARFLRRMLISPFGSRADALSLPWRRHQCGSCPDEREHVVPRFCLPKRILDAGCAALDRDRVLQSHGERGGRRPDKQSVVHGVELRGARDGGGSR